MNGPGALLLVFIIVIVIIQQSTAPLTAALIIVGILGCLYLIGCLISAFCKKSKECSLADVHDLMNEINHSATGWNDSLWVKVYDNHHDRAMAVQVIYNERKFALLTYNKKKSTADYQVLNFQQLKHWKSIITMNSGEYTKIAIQFTTVHDETELKREIRFFESPFGLPESACYENLKHLKNVQSLFKLIRPEASSDTDNA